MKSSCLLFRRLEKADAEAMASLERECFSLPWTFEQCLGALHQQAFAAFGLFAQELAGYISLYHMKPEMEILNIAVRPPYRRKGAATRMLRTVLQAGRKMGMQRVSLEVRESNLAAIGLYQQAGFASVGIRKKYYPDTGENALIQVLEFN